jgi:hypothetical protein
MPAITANVLQKQRARRFCFSALKQGKWTSWDYSVPDDSRDKYIRSHMDLDDLERRARYPIVDTHGNTVSRPVAGTQASALLSKKGAVAADRAIPHQAGALGQ